MRERLAGPMILMSVGSVLLAHNMIPGFELGHWWPLVVIATGFGLLLDRWR